MRKIVSCNITAMPKQIFDPMPEVWVSFNTDAAAQEPTMLFRYFPDELDFSPDEFIGLYRESYARALSRYLRGGPAGSAQF